MTTESETSKTNDTETYKTDETETPKTSETETPKTSETETPKPRDIGTLLSLKTYQGMTDDEIKSIIDYYIDITKKSEDVNSMIENNNKIADAIKDSYLNAANESNNILKKLVATPIKLARIDTSGNVTKAGV